MYDVFGWTCYSARAMTIVTTLDVLFWAWLAYLLYRLYTLKRELRATATELRYVRTCAIPSPAGERIWDIATPQAPRSPRRPPSSAP
jgi:hypothetical protein